MTTKIKPKKYIIDLISIEENEEIFISAWEKETKIIEESILINKKEKTISYLKVFFVKLLEESLIKDQKYNLSLSKCEEIESTVPGIIPLLKECIEVYENALK